MTAKVIRRTLEEATNVGKNHLLFNLIKNSTAIKNPVRSLIFFPFGKLTNRFSKDNVCLKLVEIVVISLILHKGNDSIKFSN